LHALADSRARGWSICGAERAQTAAIDRECGSGENGLDKPKPLPSAAISCAHNDMVRRGLGRFEDAPEWLPLHLEHLHNRYEAEI